MRRVRALRYTSPRCVLGDVFAEYTIQSPSISSAKGLNAPKTEFEKQAVAKIKTGKPYFEEVGTKDGKPVLRAATRVPR